MEAQSFTVALSGGEMYVEIVPEGLTYESRLVRDDGEPQEAIRRLSPAEVERLAGLLGAEPAGMMEAIKGRWPGLVGLHGYLIEHSLGSGFVW